jgi:hypothetical protein
VGPFPARADHRNRAPRSPPPSRRRHRDQQTAEAGPPALCGDVGYVALPGHPFYGRQVHILSRHHAATRVSCLIASPDHPALHHRLPERWLTAEPPPPVPAPARAPQPIVLPLSVLDTLTQWFLAKRRAEIIDEQPPSFPRGPTPALGATPAAAPPAGERPVVLPRPAIRERTNR